MKQMQITLLLLAFALSCTTRRPSESQGSVIAEKFFDIFKEFTKHQKGTGPSQLTVKRSELPKSFTMAVAFAVPESQAQDWRWTREEKDFIIAALETSRKSSKVFELMKTSDVNNESEALRFMAAQQGADALLLIRGVSKVETNLNGKAFTYLAVLPMLFVEGNDIKSTFITQAVLWDVKTAIVHLGVETEGEWEMERPLLFNQKQRAIEKSRNLSVRNLTSKLNQKFQGQSL
ncbi:MAG TPA: hypothetical protein VNJ01_11890 [Bacteriovoracaceae bacterium]|nr:hypothetical protein [Bacteriovoracaceae bacterium]